VEDRQATRVVQAIRSRRYVNQREIGGALGVNQATVARAQKRALNLGLITEKEVEGHRDGLSGKQHANRHQLFDRAQPTPESTKM
jgi:transposase